MSSNGVLKGSGQLEKNPKMTTSKAHIVSVVEGVWECRRNHQNQKVKRHFISEVHSLSVVFFLLNQSLKKF